jgi:hypothetical protein
MNRQSMQRKSHSLLATIGITMLASPVMSETQCPFGTGIYRNVLNPQHEIAFDSRDSGSITLKAGQAKITFKVVQWASNGFSRVHIGIGPTLQKAQGNKSTASSVVVHMSPDFSPYRGEGEAPYLVIPELAVGLYYSEGFRDREGYADLLPGDAWKLIGCKGKGGT